MVRGRQTVRRGREGVWGTVGKCRGVRHHSYGERPVTETNVETPAAQLNRSASDVPGALVIGWLAWIHLFDFDVRRASGEKYTAIDGLSQRPATVLDG
jgi:hypothetical protein